METIIDRFKNQLNKLHALENDRKELVECVESFQELINSPENRMLHNLIRSVDNIKIDEIHDMGFSDEWGTDEEPYTLIEFRIRKKDNPFNFESVFIGDIAYDYFKYPTFKKHHVEKLIQQIIDKIELA